MKKAVIQTGSKQYIVAEGDVLDIERLKADKTVTFEPLLVIEDGKTTIGTPVIKEVKVEATVVEPDILSDKTVSIRYKAKKRVHTIRGHRQHLTKIKIASIK